MSINKIKPLINTSTEKIEIKQIEAVLREIQPQSKMGKRLIELSLKGLKAGVQPMTTDEISEYLGRTNG